ncbi:lipopolysaccharide biosynthesis protein [Adhaeretor mobilis]|uniref:Polysaccharide biosynthesis protein n=1 Tax=Adhaeretor mobilis TaxID=1930276 RepID=A0A517MY73_9BACT|nr:hypothetical protein [Adhaeretor mobilis]QDS99806.1 hypothetical protein HG15A2_31370 [Adhaeretor mobilis]
MNPKANPTFVENRLSWDGNRDKEVQQQPKNGKTLSAKRHYAVSYGNTVLLLGGNLLLLRWARQGLGEFGFSELVVMRRFLSALTPILSIGLAVTLLKTVSQLAAAGDRQKSISMVACGYQVATLSCLSFLAMTLVVPRPLSRLVTGSPEFGPSLSALAVYALGLLLSVCNSSYCLAQTRYYSANAIQLVRGAICPLLVLILVDSVEMFLLVTGLALIALNLVFYSVTFDSPSRLFTRLDWKGLRGLVAQGLPRTPGDATYYGLLAMPALVASSVGGLERGGEIGYALIVLTLLMQIAVPVNQFLLPETVYLLQVDNHQRLAKRIFVAASFALITTCTGVLFIEVLAPQLVHLHLGIENSGRIEAIRWLVPAAIPLNLLQCMRGVVDSASPRAYAPHLCVGAFFVFLGALVCCHGANDLWSSVIVPFYWAIVFLSLSTCITAYCLLMSIARQSAKRYEDVAVTWDRGRAA